MKLLKSLVFFAALILAGCAEESPLITNPDIPSSTETHQWIQLPTDISQGLSIETQYSASKIIIGETGGNINLNVNIARPGHELGDYHALIKVEVQENSFPAGEERLFTVSLDPECALLYITPSPSTLTKHIKLNFEIKGIDVSNINPETFNFIYVGDNGEVLQTSRDEISIVYNKNKLKIKNAFIFPLQTFETPPGSRYGWVR